MKISRQRKLRRYLNYYKQNFSFRAPYQVLIDGTFCQEALKCQLNIQEQMPKYLESEVKLMTTSCVINEAESLGPAAYGAMLIVKQFKLRKCGHEKSPIPASECLHSMLGENNADHYFVATQDFELSKKIRKKKTPLLYVKYNAIILEKPPVEIIESDTLRGCIGPDVDEIHFEFLKGRKDSILPGGGLFGDMPQRKRKAKGPNPLSCKPKKKKVIVVEPKVSRRTRHRRRANQPDFEDLKAFFDTHAFN